MKYRALGLKHNSNIGKKQCMNLCLSTLLYSQYICCPILQMRKLATTTQLRHMLWGFLTLQLW